MAMGKRISGQAGYDVWKQQYGTVNVKDFGAVGDGVHDDTAAIQAASNYASQSNSSGQTIFLPKGSYHVTNALNVYAGCTLLGESMTDTIISVSTSFNMSANGVIEFQTSNISTHPSSGWYPRLKNIKIEFYQPDSSAISDIIQYPPAIYAANGIDRFEIRHVLIERAWNAIDMTGNAGGSIIEDLQTSFFNIGINIDGSYDIIRIDKFHAWPFGMTSNQTDLFYSNAIGVTSGRCDGLFLTSFFTICSLGIRLYESSLGTTFGSLGVGGFDTYSGLQISAGVFSISSCYFNVGNGSSQAILVTGGKLNVAASSFELAETSNIPLCEVNSSANFAVLQITNSLFEGYDYDRSFIEINQSSGAESECIIANSWIRRYAGSTYTTPAINKISGKLTCTGNKGADQNTSPVFVNIQIDDFDIVKDNAMPGWKIGNYPIPVNGVYYPYPMQSIAGENGGTIYWAQPETGSAKKVIIYLDAYENDTATAQTITFPVAFTYTPLLNNAVGVPGVTVSTTSISIDPDNTTTYTGYIEVTGF